MALWAGRGVGVCMWYEAGVVAGCVPAQHYGFFFFLLIEDSDLVSAQLLSLDAFLLRLHCDGGSSDARWQSLCL